MKVAINSLVRWVLFATYLIILFTLPVTILGSYGGLCLGLFLSSAFLFFLYYKAEEKLFSKLNLQQMALAEAPEVHHLVKELSRRLNLSPPSVAVLKSEALNIGAFGLSKKRTWIVLTEGLLKTMNRSQLSALIGRELTSVWYGDCLLSSWFARFLMVIESISLAKFSSSPSKGKRFYSPQWVVSQALFLPLALIPQFLLLGIRRSINLDTESLKLTQLPKDLAESYRSIEASASRISLRTPESLSPLFLLPPTQIDPISKLIFSPTHQAKLLSSLQHLRRYS